MDRALRSGATASSIIRASGGKVLPAETQNIQASIGTWPKRMTLVPSSQQFPGTVKVLFV
jgi:hypothetical protein